MRVCQGDDGGRWVSGDGRMGRWIRVVDVVCGVVKVSECWMVGKSVGLE